MARVAATVLKMVAIRLHRSLEAGFAPSGGQRPNRLRRFRRALELTQEEFALRYRTPIGTLRDWEQCRCETDRPARVYLTVIARDPDGVKRALTGKHS